MKNELTLVIMAAGMGSRFGGLKQIEPIGPAGEFIIDYSIYDAKEAGFRKVVFIIKEENYDIFKKTIGERIAEQVEVEYAFQKQEDVPDFVRGKSTREKPWGTAHAIMSARPYVNGPFLVINSDDFYGKEAYLLAAQFLRDTTLSENVYAGILYQVKNTLTENGSVKRGVCEVEEGILKRLIESKLEQTPNGIMAFPLNGSDAFSVSFDDLVSMNMFCFKLSLFAYLESDITTFFEKHLEDIETCEYLIPEVVFQMMNEQKAIVKGISTNARWLGVTYREDKEIVSDAISKMIEKGEYPRELWKK